MGFGEHPLLSCSRLVTRNPGTYPCPKRFNKLCLLYLIRSTQIVFIKKHKQMEFISCFCCINSMATCEANLVFPNKSLQESPLAFLAADCRCCHTSRCFTMHRCLKHSGSEKIHWGANLIPCSNKRTSTFKIEVLFLNFWVATWAEIADRSCAAGRQSDLNATAPWHAFDPNVKA